MRLLIKHGAVAGAIAVLSIATVSSNTQPLASEQKAKPEQEQQPTFRTATNYVRVDVYPTRLAMFDYPLGPEAPPPMTLDQAHLRERLESLHDLALSTDGIAVVNNNDLEANLRRIADDLTSYYLLGYYSTNTKLDGKFRRIEVRVRQPDVHVRARRGYRAPTAEEVEAARAATEAAEAAAPSALALALARLSYLPREPRFSINTAVYSDATGSTRVWIAGELPRGRGAPDLPEGGDIEIDVRGTSRSESTRVILEAGARTFVTSVSLGDEASGDVQVRARLTGSGLTIPLTASVTASTGTGQPLAFRRGPSTGNRMVPAAVFEFSRTERIRFELPLAPGEAPASGRLLDRAGGELQVPVKVDQRSDAESGQEWLTADITLAALAAGDYAAELTVTRGSDTRQIVTAFRVVR